MELDAALTFASARRQGVLTSLKADGRPHLANIIFLLVGDEALISTSDGRVKAKNLRRDARASLYVPADDFWHWVVLEGTAELTPAAHSPDDTTVEELVDLYRRLSGEHPDWDEYRQAMIDEHRVVVHLKAERAYGMIGG
jgi:PPOX class probable F420-dependent enzyme